MRVNSISELPQWARKQVEAKLESEKDKHLTTYTETQGYVALELPYPPSVNTIWRHTRDGRVYLSQKGRDYRRRVSSCVLVQARGHKAFTSPVRVLVRVYPPDKRARDIDNLMKALGDSLTLAGVYQDDSLIDELILQRKEVLTGGKVWVFVCLVD
jgi:crossover junction endodeoxyribonuclease RusA